MPDRTAYIIVDLGYGDAGKGSLVDALTARTGSKLNVRFNGGGQAAHNVVLSDGRHHTFSQFGSGMFSPDVATYLSRHFLWNPIAMQIEAKILDGTIGHGADTSSGVMKRTYVDSGALVVTPWHQAMNRLREFARGDKRHGSCGVGIGEAMAEAQCKPVLSLWAEDLRGWTVEKLRLHLEQVAHYNRSLWAQVIRAYDLPSKVPDFLSKDHDFLFNKEAPDKCAGLFKQIASDVHMVFGEAEAKMLFNYSDDVIFEGSQGILLDEKYGFDPYTTWSTCTSRNTRQILQMIGWEGSTKVIGALRAYAVRHGDGPFVTENHHYTEFQDEHNTFNNWQGTPRFGWFDAVAAHYAMAAERESSGSYAGAKTPWGIHALAITNLDRMHKMLKEGKHWKICTGYTWNGGGPLVFEPGCFTTPAVMTKALFQAEPVYGRRGNTISDLLTAIEILLHCPIEITSQGPTRGEKLWDGSVSHLADRKVC